MIRFALAFAAFLVASVAAAVPIAAQTGGPIGTQPPNAIPPTRTPQPTAVDLVDAPAPPALPTSTAAPASSAAATPTLALEGAPSTPDSLGATPPEAIPVDGVPAQLPPRPADYPPQSPMQLPPEA